MHDKQPKTCDRESNTRRVMDSTEIMSCSRHNKNAQPPLADTPGSERKLPYYQWRALGPRLAAEYVARRNGWTADREGKLWAILETCWETTTPNERGQR